MMENIIEKNKRTIYLLIECGYNIVVIGGMIIAYTEFMPTDGSSFTDVIGKDVTEFVGQIIHQGTINTQDSQRIVSNIASMKLKKYRFAYSIPFIDFYN